MIRVITNTGVCFIVFFFTAYFYSCSLITIEGDVEPLPTNELNARIMAHDFAGTVLKVLDTAADSIIKVSDDPQVHINALRWKISSIATCRSAIFQTNPILAAVDTWIFMQQMWEFLESGNGIDAFGVHQDIAKEATGRLVTKIDSITASVVPEKEYLQIQKFVGYYVKNHLLTDFEFKRPSVMSAWNEYSNIPDSLAVQTVGNLPETVSDLTSRLTYLSTELPLQAYWNAELIIKENHLDSLHIAKNIDSLNVMIANLNQLIIDSPELVDSAMASLYPLFNRIDRRWALTLTILQKESEILLNALKNEREAAMKDLNSISNNVAQIMMEKLREIINDILIYLILILLIIFGLPFTLGYLVGRTFKSKQR